jgi:outer membrane protein assembly factor BamE (lipoprotein component of BamABCDE complex)
LGQHILKKNNTLVLKFDKFGVLESKIIYDKSNTNKIAFSEKRTKNELSKKSFVESFLSSVKQKMYGNRK